MYCFAYALLLICPSRYKERLHTKYIKSLDPQDTSKFIVGRNWTFMKDGLDDFRDGLPPPVSDGCMIEVGMSVVLLCTGIIIIKLSNL